jgi:Tol biopolymer transport system component/DNA-binding winged helix-turn-helix (wHTH) protein
MDLSANGFYEFGPFCVDTKERLLLREGQVLTLTPKAFDTLLLLVENGGHVLTKDEMMSRLWPDTFVEEANLTNNISMLRKALGETENGRPYIQTVPRVGYRFVARISVARDGSARKASGQAAVDGNSWTGTGGVNQLEPAAAQPESSARAGSRASASFENTAGVSLWTSWIRRHVVGAIVISGALATLVTCLYLLRAKPKAGDSANSTLRFEFTRLTNASGEEAYPSLSPDGKSLVYTSYPGGKGAIYLLRMGGNTPIKLTSDSAAASKQPTFSPDGNFIAFSSGDSGGIFVMGATGENAKRLTEFGANPSWSPDQKQIVFTTDDTWNPTTRRINPSELWLVNVETSEKHRLPTPGDAVQPSWSPHGDRIAFWSQNAGGSDNIFTMPAAGGKPVAVTNDVFVNWNPVWSPDGRYLYFASDRGGAMNLWRLPIDEKSGNVLGSPEPLTTPAPHIEHVCFSRDGRHLAYVNDTIIQNVEEIQFDPQREAVVGEPRWVTRGIMNIASPDLSADGEWLAYGTLGEKQEDLFIIGVDGTGLRQLTNDVSKDRTPRWSPDGKRIAFESDRSGNFEIWIMNADGSQLRQLTRAAGPGASGAIWSPDGTRLAYTARGGGGTFIAEMREAAGGLTTNGFPVPGSSEADFRANSWSPDGRKLAGFSYRRSSTSPVKDAAHMLCTYSFDTQKFEQWEIAGVRPVWLNDSRRLMFISGDTVYLLDTNSKRIHKLLDAAPNGLDYLALSRDNHKILLTIANYEADIWLMTLQP